MSSLRPLWIAFRAAVIATAVFWAARALIDKIGWHAPFGLTEQAVFFAVFFFGMLMVQ